MDGMYSKLLALALVVAGLTAAAPSPQPTADSIMRRIDARNATLASFQARVHVNLRLLSFPWLFSKLDGTEYYKRPDKHGVVFDRAPSYARGINSLFGAVDAPSEWRKDSNVAYAGVQNIGGKPMFALRMTKKIYSDQIKDTVAYVDPNTYQVMRMDFVYTNGDGITMTQIYKQEGAYSVVASRHLEIKRHVRAVADATYSTYKTNVAISDAVFGQK
jgi:outer membrane lipoprotein-sorting protein